MKIATWNINSVRLRLNLLAKLLREENPDIICLQETKVRDELFPVAAIKEFGYPHIIFRGEKGYNGVAIISRLPIRLKDKLNITGKFESRHISCHIDVNGGIELHNFYVPAGGDEPDVNINQKYKYKLDFVDDMKNWFLYNRNSTDKIIVVGDLNIAPYENDVWSHKQLLNVISHTPLETTRMLKFKDSLDFIDVPRKFISKEEKLYSWWSYRNRDWKKSNRGRRLDHIFVTKPLACNISGCHTVKTTRDWEKTSDHVPVIAGFNFQ